MVLAQLVKISEKEYKWHILDYTDDQIFKIQTWKGTYEIPKPNLYNTNDYFFNTCVGYSAKIQITIIPYWINTYRQKKIYFPNKQQWFDHNENIQQDTLDWVLNRPPQYDQMHAAYEEDRVSIEETFIEIERSIKES